MKKFITFIILSALAAFAFPAIVSANEGPHGAYTITTEKCAGCHRPHTATRAKLLKGDGVDTTLGNPTNYDIADFCFSCHKDGLGANNNVYGGKFMGYAGPGDGGTSSDPTTNPWPGEPTNTALLGTKNAGLNGGGFVTAKQYWGAPNKLTYNGRTQRGVAWTDPAAGTHFDHVATGESAVTSIHNAMDDTKTWTVWGSVKDGAGAGPGMLVTLKCTSCHDQHGSRHYRILRDSRSDATIANLIPGYFTQPDESGAATATRYPSASTQITSWETEFGSAHVLTKDYTSYSYKYSAAGATTISDFCKTCHSQYYNATSPSNVSWQGGGYNAGDGLGTIDRYRHYTEKTIDASKCGGSPAGGSGTPVSGCLADNLNYWIQLPLAQTDLDGPADGIRSGRPIYQSDIIAADDYIVCTTCHQAHGTTATMVAGAKVGPTASSNATGSYPNVSNLLRLDNRGVCEDCHGWTPGIDEDGQPCSNQYDSTSCGAGPMVGP